MKIIRVKPFSASFFFTLFTLFSFLLLPAFQVSNGVAYAQTPTQTPDFLDTFTADNGTALGSYNGGIWRLLTGYGSTIQNNSVSFPGSGLSAYATSASWSEDADISVTMNPSLIGGSGSQGFGIRNDSYSCGMDVVISNYFNNGTTHSFNVSWTTCVPSSQTLYSGAKTYANSNLIHTFKIAKRGNTYSLYIDNVAVTQSTTNTYYGKFNGIIRGLNSSGLDNFSVDQLSARQTEECLVTTSPASKILSIGQTTKVTAQVASGLNEATVTRMRFGSYNTSVGTVEPTEDTDSPYETTITATAQGYTAVWATAPLSQTGESASQPGRRIRIYMCQNPRF